MTDTMAFFFLVVALAYAFVIPARAEMPEARQMVVCLAPESTSSEGTLQLFHRDAAGHWQADSRPWAVLFGRGGLAWGRGLNPPQPGRQKVSDDHCNPAGVFRIGYALGYAPALPKGAKGWPYHQVTGRDAWMDDPALPNYNHLYTLAPGAPLPPWWEKERLHLDDHAYEWMVLIEHNYDQPMPNAGTDIFFHIRRGEHYRTAGCTTMSRNDLLRLIKWLRPGSGALLAELTYADYRRLWREWNLPPAELALPKAK